MSEELQIAAFPPAKMASRMEEAGAARVGLRTRLLVALALLGGVFMGLGASFATTATSGLAAAGMGAGLVRVLGGLAFCLGMIAIVLAGAELFMGNNLVVMALGGRRVTLVQLLRFWLIVYLANLAGAIVTAVAMFLTGQYTFSAGALGASALAMANGQCSLGLFQALLLGIVGSVLICLAVWLTSSARSSTAKILALVFPITAFVAGGFAQATASAYWIPAGLLIKYWAPDAFWQLPALAGAGLTAGSFPELTWYAFLFQNLLPVTLGNIAGGLGFVGLVYWLVYLRPQKAVEVKKQARMPHILVVDDDADFVEVTSMILERDGYEISTAANGRQAWEAMMQKKPDMVLLDVMMSTTLEGVDLARRMAADSRLKDVPIIMISSIASTYHAGKLPDSIHIPIDAWLSKPVNPEVLLKTVRRFLH